jgi:hypothetical protein
VIYQVGEFLRLYAWIAMPVLLGLMFLRHWKANDRAGLICIAPLCAVWLACTSLAANFQGDETWALFASVDALAALGLLFVAYEWGPRRPLAVIILSLAAEVVIHVGYGIHNLGWEYSKTAARIDYWSTFAIALWQISIAARQGGQRGKRRGRAVFYRSDAHRGDCFGGVRLADRFYPIGARG